MYGWIRDRPTTKTISLQERKIKKNHILLIFHTVLNYYNENIFSKMTIYLFILCKRNQKTPQSLDLNVNWVAKFYFNVISYSNIQITSVNISPFLKAF